MKFRPALLIGLGGYGSDIARRMSAKIRRADAPTSPLVGLLELHDDGKLIDGIGGSEYGEIVLADAATYTARFSAIAAGEDAIEKAIVESLGQLRRREILLPLREQRVDVAGETALYFIAPLGDDVGSPALIAFLEIVRRLTESRLVGEKLHKTVLCFFPDLFTEHRDAEEPYARSFVCLQELEHIASPQSFRGVHPFDYIALFTARNEANEDLGSYENVADVLGDIFDLALRREIEVDESYSVVLANKKLGYSSMGMAKLVFPREAICRALDARFAADVLEDYGVLHENMLDRHVVSSDVRKFVFADGGLDRIETRMALDAAGQPIWRAFTTRASFSEDAYVDETLATLREDADQYERTEVSSMIATIRQTRARLAQESIQNLVTAVDGRIEHEGTRSAHAFLDVLLNEVSDYTTGDIVDNAVSADDIDLGARRFFDEVFGIPREELSKLQQEVNSKEAVLDQHVASRTAAGAEDDPELSATIDKRQSELEKLQKRRGDLHHKVRMHDLQLQDGAQRRLLLMRHRSEVDAQVREQAAAVEPLDSDYRTKGRLLANERLLFAERKQALARYAAYATVGLVVLAFLVRWLSGPIQD